MAAAGDDAAKRMRLSGGDGNAPVTLTRDEATQYDRQIRLWGVNAQNRIRAARVLIIGATGLAVELAKNTVLAGVAAVTLLDAASVTQADLTAQFYLSPADIGSNRAEACLEKVQALNPNVEVRADTGDWRGRDAAFWKSWTLVCATTCSLAEQEEINKACRASGVKFFGGQVLGKFGYIFVDLLDHHYIEEHQKIKDKKTGEKETVQTEGHIKHVPLATALAKTWPASCPPRQRPCTLYFALRVIAAFQAKHKRNPRPDAADAELLRAERRAVLGSLCGDPDAITDDYLSTVVKNMVCELGPVAAIVGGTLSTEVIKAISGKGFPMSNFFFFDSLASAGTAADIGVTEANSTQKAAPVAVLELSSDEED